MTTSQISLRDYFAARILPALYTEFFTELRHKRFDFDERWKHEVALDAYRIADAMLAMRSAKVTAVANP